MSLQPYFETEDGRVQIYLGDCLEVLPLLEAAHLVLTDPPYGIPQGSAVWRRNGTAIENWDEAGHNVDVEGWHALLNVTPDAYLAEFMGGNLALEDRVRARHSAAGWEPWRRYVVLKSAPPPTPRPTFVSGWENCLISYRGKRRWFGGAYTPDRWIGMTPNRAADGSGHPTEKPIEPIKALVQALSQPDELVLDPFVGTGTVLRAALDLGRRAIGIEIEERWCEVAAKRLAQGVLL